MRNSVYEEEPDEVVSYQDSRQTRFPAANGEISADPFAALDDMPFLQLLARATSGTVPLMDVGTANFRHHSDGDEDKSESWSAKFMPAADLEEPGGSIQWPRSSGTLMTQGAIHYPMMLDKCFDASYGAVAEYNFDSRDSLVDPTTPQRDRKEEAKHVGEDLHSTEDGSRSHNINNKIIKDGDPQNDNECTAAGFSFISGIDFKEIKSPEQGNNEEPNLKTPQQRPRKRKHRPKVIQQGESKRTPKQATPKPKNPTPKKKYVKRKGIIDQASDNKQTSRENDDQDQHYPTKRCSRRALNFTLEDHEFRPYLNMNSVWHEQRDQSNSFQQTKHMSTTASKNLQSDAGELKGNQQACFQMKSGADGSQETVYKSSTSGENKKMPKLATPKTTSSSVKRKYIRRNGIDGQTSKHEKVTGDGRKISCGAPTLDLDDQQQNNSRKPCLNVNSVLHQYSFSSTKDQSYSVEQYGQGNASTYKDSRPGFPNLNEDTDFATLDDQESAKLQEFYYTSDHAHHNIMDLLKAEYNLLQAQAVGVDDSIGIISCTSFSESYMEIYNKMRTVMEHNSIASTTPSPGETSRNVVEETRQGILFDPNFSTLLASFNPNIQSNVEANASLPETQFMTHHRLHGNVLVPLDMQIQNISNGPAQVRDLSSLAVIEKFETPPGFFANPAPVTVGSGQDDISNSLATYTEALVAKEKARLARRKRTERMKVTRSKSSAPKHVTSDYLLSVDVLIERLKLLDISRQNMITYEECNTLVPHGTRYQEQNKLVLYERDGAVVPLDGSLSMLKRRRARPRVDLDEETNRVWNLLLENIDNQGINGTDEEKVRWWEEERSVFQGRASSFIARMRLVQGDRRFSQWKGSVVDSVVGVFLTQNVSDHLSSSAFISLAAHFPLKQSSSNQECHEDMASVLEVEPEVCKKSDSEQKREETINNNESWDSSTGSLSSSEVSESNLDDCGSGLSATPGKSFTRLKPRTRSECVTEEKNRLLQDGVSSQGSVVFSEGSPDTSCTHSADRIRPNTETSTDAQEPTNGPSRSFNGRSFMELLEMSDNLVYCENRTPRVEFMEPDLNLEDFQIQPESMLVNRQGHDGAFYDSESALGESNIPSSNHWMNETEDVQSGLVTTIMEGESLNKAHEEGDGKKSIDRKIFRGQIEIAKDTTNASNIQHYFEYLEKESTLGRQNYSRDKPSDQENVATSNDKKRRAEKDTDHVYDWDSLKKQAQEKSGKRERPSSTRDSLDWEAVRRADVKEIAKVIKARGMNNRLAERIKDFLNRLVRDHESIDLEWLKDVPPDKAKEYLLSIRGLGLKSTECVRLLTLQHLAFPVDTNVGRIAVRLGWVPLQPLPESLQLHLLELYPVMESIQKYLWPRLCKLDQLTLYELHYQMITFGKVFCTKSKPNCNACPMRGECRHFASAFASSRLALPGPQEKSIMIATQNREAEQNNLVISNPLELPAPSDDHQAQINKQLQTNEASGEQSGNTNCYPIIEEPKTPEPECTQVLDSDIEDAGWEDPDEIPTIRLNIEEFSQNLQNYMQQSMDLQEGDASKALVALTSEVASIPAPKLKNMSQLRTEHQAYELPDSHPLLKELDNRELDDPCSYLLAIWTPGETATSIQPPENKCCSQDAGQMCQETTCFACSSMREANSQTVRGTLLIPCRTAMKGSFPLNGTYFQVNELFADHDSSLNPIDVPRDWIWNLPRRTVYFGTSIPTIFKGLSTQEIQHCFWRGCVCVRGFDRKTRAPRPLMARLHFPASKMSKKKGTKTNTDGQKTAPS